MADLNNTTSNTVVSGTSSNDVITNSGSNVLINGGAGDDTITNKGTNKTVNGTETVTEYEDVYGYVDESYTDYVTEYRTERKYVASYTGSGGSYYDVEVPYRKAVTKTRQVYKKIGTKPVTRTVSNPTTTTVNASSVTINGGAGNDSISLGSATDKTVIQYTAGDGNDKITGFGATDTLSISGGSYTTTTSGSDILVNVGSGTVTLVGAKGTIPNIKGTYGTSTPATTSGGGGTSTTSSGGGTSTTSGGGSGQTISNSTANTLISGTGYADSIYNGTGGNYATINTYAGNDIVTNYGDTIQIDTGAGDDSIYSYSYWGKINAGTGNDTVSLYSTAHDNEITYAEGDGNDIIYNLDDDDGLIITSGSYSTQVSGSDILVHVGSGTITLSGAKGTNPNISGTYGTSTPATTSGGGGTSITSNHLYTGGNAVIHNYAGEKITVGMLPKEWMFYGNDFYYGSNTGTLVVQDVKDKIIDFRDGYGNAFVKAYKATNAGVINGRTWSGFEYIVGSDYGSDAIFAGDGGASLWGGAGNYSDTLIGGAATDVFVTGKNQGSDVISNASIADVVWLRDVNFSDIKYTASSNGVIGMEFNTGNTLLVGSTSNISAIFQFADGSSRRYNHATKSWQST